MSAWDKQPKEPPKAYSAFCVYRDLGPQERTLEKVGKIMNFSAAYAENLSSQWNWIRRCDQWDAHLQATIDRAFLTEAAKHGRQRAQAFTALLTKSLQALKEAKIEGNSLKDVAAAMKIATEGLRLEEGLETKRVSMEVTDVRTVLSRLPAEVRAPLLRAFAADARAAGHTGDSGGVPLGMGYTDREAGDDIGEQLPA